MVIKYVKFFQLRQVILPLNFRRKFYFKLICFYFSMVRCMHEYSIESTTTPSRPQPCTYGGGDAFSGRAHWPFFNFLFSSAKVQHHQLQLSGNSTENNKLRHTVSYMVIFPVFVLENCSAIQSISHVLYSL